MNKQMMTYWRFKWNAIYKREQRYWKRALIVAFLVWVGVMSFVYMGVEIQTGIAQKVLRFHVIANSDSSQDQALKLMVRDAILQQYGEQLLQCTSKEESIALFSQCKQEISDIATTTIQQQGYDYDVSVSMVRECFPEKQYGTLTFPAGVYDAVRIELGESQGQNWWCVLYPQMCYVDATWNEVTEESMVRLEQTLNQEEYMLISSEQNEVIPHIQFKCLEWLQNLS